MRSQPYVKNSTQLLNAESRRNHGPQSLIQYQMVTYIQMKTYIHVTLSD